MSHSVKSEHYADAAVKKYIDPKNIEEKVRELRLEGKKIATLNGSFDLLHAGHLEIFYQASRQADVLLVALNTDASIKKYKGENRPIIELQYRLQMVSALWMVDYVTWFDESTPISFLEKVRPDVHVNGSEYGEDCIEADVVKKHGGKLYIVERIPSLSTSEVIEKIEALCV